MENDLVECFRRNISNWQQTEDSSDFRIPKQKQALSSLKWPQDLELPKKWNLDLWQDYFPWELSFENLIDLYWEHSAMPGASHSMSFWALRLPELGTVYGESGQDFYQLLCFSNSTNTARSDRYFLGQLIQTNGLKFNTGIFGDPPSDITIHLPTTRDYLVNAFVSGFDISNSWGRLIELFDEVWNDEYEDPLDSLIISNRSVENFRSVYYESEGDPTSYAGALYKENEFSKWLYGIIENNEQSELPNKPLESGMLSKYNKWKITERYLANVIYF